MPQTCIACKAETDKRRRKVMRLMVAMRKAAH